MLLQHQQLIALTMWLADDNGLLKGTKEDRVVFFREYLDCLSVSAFHPIPKKFAEEMLRYNMEGVLSLSHKELQCLQWNVGREGAAKFIEIPSEEVQPTTRPQDSTLKLVANPKSRNNGNRKR